jgi:dienelactone hydrolase
MSRKQASRALLYGLLGDLPPRERPISARVVGVEKRGCYNLETLSLDLNGEEPVPAYFTRPRGAVGPLPAVVYSHSHGGDYALGKDEFLRGREYLADPPWAEELARLGVCGLAIDAWVFGGRAGRSESAVFKDMLWRGEVLWGRMVFDTLRAADYLVSRPEVDAARIGSMGMSMGATMAWWHAALDERVKVCVDICCLTDFQALAETDGFDAHGLYYYVPGLRKHFTAAEINALIAPRAHLALAGAHDPLTPAAGLDRVDAALRAAYAAEGVPHAWRLSRHDVGHMETPAMRAEARAWLAAWL